MRREQRDREIDANEEAVFFSLKPPQTNDMFSCNRENRRRRVTKKKLDFSRWIFWSDENVKIILVSIDVFEYRSKLKNMILWDNTAPQNDVCMHLQCTLCREKKWQNRTKMNVMFGVIFFSAFQKC